VIEEEKREEIIVFEILLFLHDLTACKGEILVSGISCTVVSVLNNNKKRRRRIHEERVW
jgi:riboflavin synthase alpha subunit